MHPANLLSLLISLAAIGGALGWNSFLASQQSASTPAPIADAAVAAPAIVSETSVAESPTGTLQRQVQRLEDQNQLLQKENADLRQQLARELEAKAPPPEPGKLATRLAELRKLPFTSPPKLQTLPLPEIQQKVLAMTAAQLTDDACAARSKAYQAMGIVQDSFNYREAVQNVMANQFNTYYDPATQEAVYQADADLRRLEGRDLVVAAAHRALLAQHFPASSPPPLETANDDAACAIRALAWGENSFYRVRWALQDDLVNLTSAARTPFVPNQTFTPLFFTEQYKFCVDAGKSFTETLLSKEGETVLTQCYKRPPGSTTEILHPELYLSQPPFQPTIVEWSDQQVLGKAPYFANVAGEFTTDMMFRYFMSPDLAMRISDGWAGDGYMVYAGDGEHGDHVCWKSHWRTPEDGQEFFEGLRRVLMQRHTIPWQPEFDNKTAFLVNDPHRVIRLRLSGDGKLVTLVNASEAAFADALDERWGVKN